jgi:hypothetical protein
MVATMGLALICRRFAACLVLSAVTVGGQEIKFALLPDDVVRGRILSLRTSTVDRHEDLVAQFQSAGCGGVWLTEQPVKRAKTPNIICTLSGESPGVILVTAHYDMTGPGQGAIDNWSGASLLPDLYAAIAAFPRRHTIRFIGFTDEETGLVGSRAYVSNLDKVGLQEIRAVINLDSLGSGPASVWASRADPRLLFSLRQVESALQLGLSWVNVDGAGDTDSHPFMEKSVPVIDFHSLTRQTYAYLHTAKDNLQAFQFDDYVKTYRTLAAYLAFLDLDLETSLSRKVKIK